MSSSVATARAATDEPDLAKEKKLHRLYQLNALSPTNEEAWSGAISGRVQTYTVQSADNLWQLSEVLFGDPQFWPKIWSLNVEKIENPHEIFPGQSVSFTPGSLNQPPVLAVTDPSARDGTEEAEESEDADDSETADAGSEETETGVARADQVGPDINAEKERADQAESDPRIKELLNQAQLPPEAPHRPVGRLPESLPRWSFGRRIPKLDVIVNMTPRKFSVNPEVLSYYLLAESPEGLGVIKEMEMGQKVASDLQYVYVKMDQEMPGKSLMVIREEGTVKDQVTGDKGKMIQVQGELEVIEKVNAEENIYRCIVKRTIQPIEIGSLVLAGPLPVFTAVKSAMSHAQARIIGGEKGTVRRMLSSQSLVFMNGSGLVEGQSYPIYRNPVARNTKSVVVENPLQIGTVKVVKVSESFATAILLQASEEIVPGDLTDPKMSEEY